MTNRPLHFRAYAVTVAWTLALLFLGSVVHATGSSLACPDWPTCYGTMMPEMEGGVFWEHLHRLVAGGLVLMFALATWLVRSEEHGLRWLFHVSLAGMGLLLVQAVFGGVTVLLQLPDWISTTHLGLAFVFLALATVLAAASSPARARRPDLPAPLRRELVRWGAVSGGLVMAQSLLGGAVRHMDAGMACPEVPTCLGRWVPPLTQPLVAVHFSHRVLGVVTLLVVLIAAAKLSRAGAGHVRRAAGSMAALVIAQVGLGLASIGSALAVIPVSLHTLVAASLLAVAVLLTTWGALPPVRGGAGRTASGAVASAGPSRGG